VKQTTRYISVLILFTLLQACGDPNQRLDEFEIYNGPQFRLKLVSYYRNIPFNYLGEQVVVMCQSENTAEFSANDRHDAGWRMLGAVAGQGNMSAREAAAIVQDDYDVLDQHILVAKTTAFNISFDACGHFISWDPGHLPDAMINPVVKPDSCAPNGPVDCRYHDFEGDRTPRYDQIRVPGLGQVSFTATSKAFEGVEALHVHTSNNGAVWHVDTVGLNAGMQRLVPDTLRTLSVAALETGMPDVSLADWLESSIPPRSMVIWPDALTACGEEAGADAPASLAPCAVILFKDREGNSGALYITMSAAAEHGSHKATFGSAIYLSGAGTRSLGSLADVRASLESATK
jgi:hypothetical protein